MLTIRNNGPEIEFTDYWQSEQAAMGYVYLSINAGCFRLLVPTAREPDVLEMLTGREALVSRGPWTEQGGREAVEILFEDNSNNPYVLHMVSEQCDRLPANSDRNKTFTLAIWTRAGKQGEMPARLRFVKRLPWLKPWRDSH